MNNSQVPRDGQLLLSERAEITAGHGLLVVVAGGLALVLLAGLGQSLVFGFSNLSLPGLFLPFLAGACATYFGVRIMNRSLRGLERKLCDDFEARTREFRRNEQRFHEYLQTSKQWFWETDSEHRFVFLSAQTEQTDGIDDADLLGCTREDLRPPSDDPLENEHWDGYLQSIRQRRPFNDFEYRAKLPNGRERLIRANGKPIFDDDGNFQGYRGLALDVTAETHESRARLRNPELIYTATQLMSDGFVLFDADDRLVMCNARYRQLYPEIEDIFEPGVSFREITRAYADTLKFDSSEDRDSWIDTRVDRHQNLTGSYDQYLSDGRWIRIIDQKLPGGGVVGLRVDMTEVKRIEQELEAAQRLAHVGSWRWDVEEDRLIFCSREYAEIHGVPEGEIHDNPGRNRYAVIHPDDRENVRQAITRSVDDGSEYEIEYRLSRPSGATRHVVERGVPSKFRNGRVVEQFGILQDVTEGRRQAEDKQKSDDMLEAAIENVPGGFLVINPEGVIERFNRKFFDLYPKQQFFINEGVPFERFLQFGIDLGVYQEAGDNPDEWKAARLQLHQSEVIEYIDRLDDGRSIQVALRQLTDHSRVAMHVDVTELQLAREVAEQANEAKSEFLASMSHELRTPMHGILSFAELGLKRLDTLSQEKLRQYLENIQISGTRLLFLLNDLLDLSKLEAGRMQLDLARVGLADLVDACIQEQALRLREKNLRCNFETGGAGLALCDRNRIMQVITNIVANAIKFSPEGGEILIRLDCDEESSLMRVSDEGSGIPGAELDQVFDKFYQSSGSRGSVAGTGLGLAICREIVELHGGKIWAKNNSERGASIFFELPARR